jgi:hypothetical protein
MAAEALYGIYLWPLLLGGWIAFGWAGGLLRAGNTVK